MRPDPTGIFVRMTTYWKRLATLALGLFLLPPAAFAAPMGGKEPIFTGAQACGACHEGPAFGHQFSKWRLSAHAKAYASLALPESKEIVRLSGLTEEPHQSKMCLGCHATAAEAEEWERAENFHVEDGLQCEACHGAGSEYAPEEIMKDRTQAMMHGLKMPTKEDCLICHRAKGSHDAVLTRPPFDLDSAWLTIAHPTPKPESTASDPAAPESSASPFRYTGVMACATCHAGPMVNFQFSVWRRSKHAQAYAVLATARGAELAREAGVAGDPQKDDRCLKCHVTGSGFAASAFMADFDSRDGVQCEACHGPGSGYSPEAIMRDLPAARANGLEEVTAKVCLPCHEQAHGKIFDFEVAVKKIAHPTQPPPVTVHEPAYKNPLNLALTPNGQELWVACEASASVVVIDTATHRKVDELTVGGQPNDVCFTPDGERAFVSNRLDDSVSVVEVATRKVIETIDGGRRTARGARGSPGPTSLCAEHLDRQHLGDRRGHTRGGQTPQRLALPLVARRVARRPNHLVTHALSRFVPERTPSMSEVTVIDTERAVVTDRSWSRRRTCSRAWPGIPAASSPSSPCCAPRTWCP
jgi:YVTN family beta-propeller protein